MKRKSINKIILTLSITLMSMIGYTAIKYINLKNNKQKIMPIQVTKDINLISKEILIKKLNNENKMLVLSGEVEIDATYSNNKISEDDVNFKWVKDWFSKMNSKDLIVKATYTYYFHYDLEDLGLEVVDNEVNINLSKNRISCNVELVENKSFYSDRVGLLENPFTPQEINSLNERTKVLVYNRVQSDKELRSKVMQSTQDNINKLLGLKCNYNIAPNDVVENETEIIKIIK